MYAIGSCLLVWLSFLTAEAYLFLRLPGTHPPNSAAATDLRLASAAAVVDALLAAPAAMLVLLYGARRINRFERQIFLTTVALQVQESRAHEGCFWGRGEERWTARTALASTGARLQNGLCGGGGGPSLGPAAAGERWRDRAQPLGCLHTGRGGSVSLRHTVLPPCSAPSPLARPTAPQPLRAATRAPYPIPSNPSTHPPPSCSTPLHSPPLPPPSPPPPQDDGDQKRDLIAGKHTVLLALFSNPTVPPKLRKALRLEPLRFGQEMRFLLRSVPKVKP